MDQNSEETNIATRTVDNGWTEKTITFTFDYSYQKIPSEVFLYFDPKYTEQPPFVTMEWRYPDGRSIELKRTTAEPDSSYDFELGIPVSRLLGQNPKWRQWYDLNSQYTKPAFNMLFAEPGSTQLTPQRGTYQLAVTPLLFEPDSDLQVQFVLLGQVYGPVGTDYARRDLLVPLFWGMPFALFIGLLGTLITTLVAMLLPAIGVWYGGWVDVLIQRLSEINMVLPGLAIAVLANVLFNWNIWIILGIVVVINSFGSPLKIIRSALLQAKEAPYIESARSYGASNFRIITHYLLPRIMPVLIPQLVTQVPSFIFWEATLGFFNIQSVYPTWGRIIYDGLASGALYGSPFWVLEPIFLLLLTGLAFAMLGSALERILNPRILDSMPLQDKL
jgi:peptide/nickel transport system permease protein